MKFQTKEDKSIEARKQEAENVRTKYPDRIPVIVERVPGSQIPDVRSRKFLVPNDITMTQFIMVILKVQRTCEAGLENAVVINSGVQELRPYS